MRSFVVGAMVRCRRGVLVGGIVAATAAVTAVTAVSSGSGSGGWKQGDHQAVQPLEQVGVVSLGGGREGLLPELLLRSAASVLSLQMRLLIWLMQL